MNFFKIFVFISILTILFNCDKIKNGKNKINPAGPYKEAGIDSFYWEAEDDDKYYVSLAKPLRLIKWKGTDQWILDTSITDNINTSIVLQNLEKWVLSPSFEFKDKFNIRRFRKIAKDS